MQQVDVKTGVAHVDLLQQEQDQTSTEVARGQEVDAAATAEGQDSTPADADDGGRVFFLLKVRSTSAVIKVDRRYILGVVCTWDARFLSIPHEVSPDS